QESEAIPALASPGYGSSHTPGGSLLRSCGPARGRGDLAHATSWAGSLPTSIETTARLAGPTLGVPDTSISLHRGNSTTRPSCFDRQCRPRPGTASPGNRADVHVGPG